MNIYPALDLLDGKCVRLQKGDFDQKTTYSDDPIALIKTFSADGAKSLHLVDLSGAKDPKQRQLDLITKIVKSTSLQVQCGGGVRTLAEVKALRDCGVDRVVVGSLAVNDPDLVKQMLQEFGPEHITLAVDVVPADGQFLIAIQGWKKVTSMNLETLIQGFESHRISRILCTDISRDGMLAGPNLGLYEMLLKKFPGIDFQASGGMSKAQDIYDLEKIGVQSLVIGKAMYEGKISLKEVLAGAKHVN